MKEPDGQSSSASRPEDNAAELLRCLKWAYGFAQGTYDIPDLSLHNTGFEKWLSDCAKIIGRCEGNVPTDDTKPGRKPDRP